MPAVMLPHDCKNRLLVTVRYNSENLPQFLQHGGITRQDAMSGSQAKFIVVVIESV
jgi:hypothetical protein